MEQREVVVGARIIQLLANPIVDFPGLALLNRLRSDISRCNRMGILISLPLLVAGDGAANTDELSNVMSWNCAHDT